MKTAFETMSGSFLGKLKALDAFPKIQDDFYSKTMSGGIITMVSTVAMFFLFFTELSALSPLADLAAIRRAMYIFSILCNLEAFLHPSCGMNFTLKTHSVVKIRLCRFVLIFPHHTPSVSRYIERSKDPSRGMTTSALHASCSITVLFRGASINQPCNFRPWYVQCNLVEWFIARRP